MAEGSRISPEERLFSLTLALIDTRNGLSKDEILTHVRGYAEDRQAGVDPASLERKFERDKNSLRELGIPLETIDDPGDPGNNQTLRYRIPRAEYRFPPEIRFSPKELALLNLAGLVWQEGSLATAARRARLKLGSLGELADDSVAGYAPRLRLRGKAFEVLNQAIFDQEVVRFAYLKPGQAEPLEREVLPLAQVLHEQRWHLVAEDRRRDGARRTFLLSRIAGEVVATGERVPHELRGAHDQALAELEALRASQQAELRLVPGSDAELRLRRRAIAAEGDRMVIHYTDEVVLADELAAFGPEVLVLAPPSLRELVQQRLWLVLAALGEQSAATGGRA